MGLGVSIKTSPPNIRVCVCMLQIQPFRCFTILIVQSTLTQETHHLPPRPIFVHYRPVEVIDSHIRSSRVRGKVIFSVISVCRQGEGSPKRTSLNRSMWLVEGGIPCASGSWGVCHWVCVCAQPPEHPPNTPPHGQQAGGTHPTGMLSIIFNHKNPIVKLSFRVYLKENSVMMRNHITTWADLFPRSNLFHEQKALPMKWLFYRSDSQCMYLLTDQSLADWGAQWTRPPLPHGLSFEVWSLGQGNIFTGVSYSILGGGVCTRGVMQTPLPQHYGIRSTSGRYPSYWNFFLFYLHAVFGEND